MYVHCSAVEGYAVVLFHSFDGVASPFEDDIGGAERSPGSVVVNGSVFEGSEFGEKFLDVRIRDSKVQVGDHEFGGAHVGLDDGSGNGGFSVAESFE